MNTPRRTVRIEDELWDAAVAKAHKEGTNVAEVIRAALTDYVKAAALFGLAGIALILISACGAEDGATLPAAERSAVASAPVPVVSDEPVVTESATPECWSMSREIAAEYNAFLPGPALDEWLTALPEPSQGCTIQDSQQLSEFKGYLD